MSYIEEIKSRLTLLLSIYPLAVGLYATGFFWDIPNDIIGSFDLTDFIFKASIVYLKGIAAIGIPFLLLAVIYSPIVQGNIKETQEVNANERETWQSMPLPRKIMFSLACLGLISLVAFALYLEPIEIKGGPDKILAAMFVIFLGGMVLRPFLSSEVWLAGRIILGFAFFLFLPIFIGYNDADTDSKSPEVKIGDQLCPVIFAGTESIIARCKADVVVIHRSDDLILRWRR